MQYLQLQQPSFLQQSLQGAATNHLLAANSLTQQLFHNNMNNGNVSVAAAINNQLNNNSNNNGGNSSSNPSTNKGASESKSSDG